MQRIRRQRSVDAPEPATPVPAGLEWFWEKYHDATEQIVEFCAACSVSLGDLDIADLGCGEGSMALGLHRRIQPRKLIAFDIKRTDVDELRQRSVAVGAGADMPSNLEFRQSTDTAVPAEDRAFDFVYSWSAFEHIANPIAVLEEVRRILRPSGHFFLQLWPFYLSAQGSHLWQWFDEDFHHLYANERDVVAEVAADDRQPREWADYMTAEFERLNRITLAELQRAVLVSGFDVIRIELISRPTVLTPTLARYAWTDLAVGGIKFLARPRP
jgi:ubiquinone/menaquinone biosynthesis C-methylase UbiE